MHDFHAKCVDYENEATNQVNYVRGSNIAGFVKVANAMLAYGVV